MNRKKCFVLIVAYIVFLISLLLAEKFVFSQKIIMSLDECKKSDLQLEGLQMDGGNLTFEQASSHIFIKTEPMDLEFVEIRVKRMGSPVTCQIYVGDTSSMNFSADNSSSLTKLNEGKNIITLMQKDCNYLRMTFRCIDYTTANAEIDSISFYRQRMFDKSTIYATLFLVSVIEMVLFIFVGLTNSGRQKMCIAVRSFVTRNKNMVLLMATFMVSLAIIITHVPIEMKNIYQGSDMCRRFLSKIQYVFSKVEPIVQFLIFLSTYISIRFMVGKIRKCINLYALLLSEVAVVTTMCGDSFYYTDSLDLLFSNDIAQIMVNCIVFVGFSIAFYLASAYAMEMTDQIGKEKMKTFPWWKRIYRNHPVVTLTLLILLFWLPYIVIYAPAIIPADTVVQIDMWFSDGIWSNASPLFSTFLIGGFIELGRLFGSDNLGVFLYVLLQTIVLAMIFSICFKMMVDSFVHPVVQKIWLVSVMLLPVYPCSAIQLGKDTNYTISVMIFTIFLTYVLKDPARLLENRRCLVLFTLDMIYMSLVRHNGIYVLALSAIVLLAFLKERRYFIRLVSCFVATGIVFLGFNAVSAKIIQNNNIAKGIIVDEPTGYKINAMFTVMHNMIARYVKEYKDELSPDELEIINNVYTSTERLAETYNPEITDYSAAQWRNGVTKDKFNEFKALFIKLMIRHPKVFLEGFFNKCYGYFYPNHPGKTKDYVWLSINTKLQEIPEVNITHFKPDRFPTSHMRIYSYMCVIRELPVFSVLSNVGIYSWLLLYVILVLIRKRQFKYLFAIVPIAASLAVCVLSPVNAYIRYALPVIFSAPILLSLCFGFCANERMLKEH